MLGRGPGRAPGSRRGAGAPAAPLSPRCGARRYDSALLVTKKVTKAAGAAYRKLKALIEKQHPQWRLSLQAKPVANGSGHIGWVRPGNEAAWQEVHSV